MAERVLAYQLSYLTDEVMATVTSVSCFNPHRTGDPLVFTAHWSPV